MLAGDFIASLLTENKNVHSKAYSAKQHYSGNNFPNRDFFASIDKDFETVYEEKTVTHLSSVESPIGTLSKKWAQKTECLRVSL
jgi:ribulose kinase